MLLLPRVLHDNIYEGAIANAFIKKPFVRTEQNSLK